MALSEKNGIVFDAGPIISLTLSGLVWVLEKLKKNYQGKFIIPPAVKKEIIDQPMSTRKYKFESIRILPYIANGTLSLVTNEEIVSKANEIANQANSIFSTRRGPIKIVHPGETEAIAACLLYEAKTLVIDERTTRYLIEAPEKIKRRLEKKLHTKVRANNEKLKEMQKSFREIQPIRSTELLTIAFEKGYLDFYEYSNIDKRTHFKQEILEGALWALKDSGCAVLDSEINTIVSMCKNWKKKC